MWGVDLAHENPYPTSPYFWGMMAVFSLAGLLVFLPLHYLQARRGFAIWPAAATVRNDGAGSAELTLPTLRDSWWAALIAFGVMVVVVGIAGATFG